MRTNKSARVIRTESDFRTLLNVLLTDLADAQDHFALYSALVAASTKYEKGLSQAQTFWFLTVRAHRDAAIFRLCRAFDQDPDALALRGFVEMVKSRPPFLPKATFLGQEAGPALEAKLTRQLEKALEFVNQDSNALVESLMMWRMKALAHRDVKKTLLSNLAEEYPVTDDDIRTLIDGGFQIISQINIHFFQVEFAPRMAGTRDFEKVLQAVEASVEALEAALKKEFELIQKELGTDPTT